MAALYGSSCDIQPPTIATYIQQVAHMSAAQGDTSPQSEPGRYLQAVQALLHRYSQLTAADLSAAAQPPAAAMAAGMAAAAAAHEAASGPVGCPGIPSADGKDALQLLPPLVINTPGWITGLGLDLLADVLRCAGPTHGE